MARGLQLSRDLRTNHRVALEFEVVDDSEAAEPEDWDLEYLRRAVRAGMATPLRTIQGLVIDSENDRLSRTLEAVADDLDEQAQLHWLASARPWPKIARTLHRRPSIEALVELERLSAGIRRVACRLSREGL
jgi:hypothetical protein